MKDLKILKSHLFITGLLLLLLNDFVLKELFHNWFTGKLSDFAGLLIFPLFWIAFFPRHKAKIFWLTGLSFLFWKSSYSQGSIDFWNGLQILNVNRVVDYSDLVALVVLPVAFYKTKGDFKKLRLSPVIPLLLSVFAFSATSYQKDYDYNKTYDFPFSKQELIKRINAISSDSLNVNQQLSEHLQLANHGIKSYSDSLWYYAARFDTHIDTMYAYKDRTKIDTIYHYKIPIIDTMYLNRFGIFHYSIPAKKYMKESKTSYCHTVPAKLILKGDNHSSSLTLVTIFTHNCMGMFEKEAEKNEEKNLQKAFEKEVVDRLKN